MSATKQDETENEYKRSLKKLTDAFKADGFSGINECVKRSLNKWKNIPLNIAVTGSVKAGKSSFINAIRGLRADDKGAAEVGVTQKTIVPTPYPHPDNDSLKFWDLPGVGTRNFPQATYLQKVDFDRFDFFLIFSCSTFTELDLWLAKQVKSLEKKFYFIRTKVDIDIYNDHLAHQGKHNEADVQNLIKEDISKQLKEEGFRNPKIFLINNFEPRELDFGALSESLIQDLPALKMVAFTFSVINLTENVIRQKEKYLKRRIFKVAIASAAAAAAPIPGAGAVVDIAVLLEEAIFYRKQLGLDDLSMEKCANALNMSITDLTSSLNLESTLISLTARGLQAIFATLAIWNATENAFSIALPLVGSVAAAGVSYGAQVFCLRSLLEKLVKDALKINQRMAVEVAKKTI